MHTFHVCWCAQDEKFAYLQFTVRFWTTHTFAAYDAKGKLVAGDPDRPLPVRPPARPVVPCRRCRPAWSSRRAVAARIVSRELE